MQTAKISFSEVPDGIGAMAVMGVDGDTKHMWDKTKPVEVAAARAMFDSLKKEKYLVFKAEGKDGTKGEQVSEFSPDDERYIFIPPMVGG